MFMDNIYAMEIFTPLGIFSLEVGSEITVAIVVPLPNYLLPPVSIGIQMVGFHVFEWISPTCSDWSFPTSSFN